MSRTASLLLTLALAAPPSMAVASDEVFTVIRDKGAAANAAFSKGDFASAAELYAAVEALLKTVEGRDKELAIVRFNLGRCYDELGRSVEALDAYRRSLEGPLDGSFTGPIRDRVRELESEALGRITVTCDVPEATVEVVGMDARGACGHTFLGVTPGPHVVVARRPDGRTQQAPAEVVAGATIEVRVLAAEPSGSVDVLAWSLTGGAVLVLGGGVVLNLAARDARDQADRLDALYQANGDDATRAARDEEDENTRTYGTASYVLLGVGAGLAAGAAWAWLSGSDDDGMAMMPWVGPDGLGVVGRF